MQNEETGEKNFVKKRDIEGAVAKGCKATGNQKTPSQVGAQVGGRKEKSIEIEISDESWEEFVSLARGVDYIKRESRKVKPDTKWKTVKSAVSNVLNPKSTSKTAYGYRVRYKRIPDIDE